MLARCFRLIVDSTLQALGRAHLSIANRAAPMPSARRRAEVPAIIVRQNPIVPRSDRACRAGSSCRTPCPAKSTGLPLRRNARERSSIRGTARHVRDRTHLRQPRREAHEICLVLASEQQAATYRSLSSFSFFDYTGAEKPEKSFQIGRCLSNMKNIRWDDLHIFSRVARAGGLSGASASLSMSVATIGRRMLALEHATGKSLFVRAQTGYRLTTDGRILLRKVQSMEASARPIAEWLAEDQDRPVVRISAGTWTASFLADNFMRLWNRNDPFRICFKATEARLDIVHREIEIGIRNQPAESGNVASRRLQDLAFAPFRARNLPEPVSDEWVAVGSEEAATRSARWMLAQRDAVICAWVNTPRLLHNIMRAGAGKGIMPCFIGDRDPTLERAGPLIDELAETQWLVMHNDDRHRPEVRRVIERISALAASHAPLLRGDRPIETPAEAV